YAILTDRTQPAVLPRWLGYLNIWAPLIYSPAVLLPFFKTGPFDWRGIFVFFVPGAVFTIQFTANTLCMVRAIGRVDRGAGGEIDATGDLRSHSDPRSPIDAKSAAR